MKNTLLERLTKEKDTYGYSHRHLAQYVITHPDEVPHQTILELSKKAYCSPSSVSRFVNKLGYSSYYEFCSEIKKKEGADEIEYGIKKSFILVDEYFEQNLELINQLVRKFLEVDRVYIFATGSSIIPALDFERKYRRKIDKKVLFSPMFETQYENLSQITDADLVILVSNSGESRELLKIANAVNSYTLVTNRQKSRLAKHAQECISLENHIEALSEFKDTPKASKYSLLYFFDLLFETIYDTYSRKHLKD